jgi:hypothetical protein
MDATTMHSTNWLLPKLQDAYPQLTFTESNRFAWSPDAQTVYFDSNDTSNTDLLIHELAHGLLGHHDYSKDIELVAMESQAWDKALELAALHHISISDDTIQDNLDTYREWLHARSTCPSCEATGYQSGKNAYSCVACSNEWRVNEARLCALRRYATK